MAKSNGTIAKEPVSVSMSTALVNRLSKYCFKKDLPVSVVVCRAIKRFLAAEMGEDTAFWEELYDKFEDTGKL